MSGTQALSDSGSQIKFNYSAISGETLTYSATGLPEGFEIDPDTGAIDGTPVASSQSIITITVSSSQGVISSLRLPFTVTIVTAAVTAHIANAQACADAFIAVANTIATNDAAVITTKYELVKQMTHEVVKASVPQAFDILYNLHLQYEDTDLDEKYFFKESGYEFTPDDERVMEIYTAFRSITKWYANPIDLSKLRHVTNDYNLLSYL